MLVAVIKWFVRRPITGLVGSGARGPMIQPTLQTVVFFLTKNHCDTQLSTRAAHLSFSTYAVQAAVLRGSTNYLLSAEGCGRLSEGRQGLRFDLRFLRGLCGIFAVSCGSSWL